MRKPLQDIWYEIGITINNDPDMLEEVRRIKKEADRLPQGEETFSVERRWVAALNRLVDRAWEQAASFYENGELGSCSPQVDRLKLFDVTYCEDPGKAVR